MEKIIEEKMQRQHADEYYDAFDYMLSSAKENGQDLSIQELKVQHRPHQGGEYLLCASIYSFNYLITVCHPCQLLIREL